MTYRSPSPDFLSLMDARDRYVVFAFCRGSISGVWSEKPEVQFQALRISLLRFALVKMIKFVKGVSCVHSGSVSRSYRGWLS